MRSLRYAINITLDGCCHHEAVTPDDESHEFWGRRLAEADGIILGRTTYEMMESAWRRPASGEWPEWMTESDIAFAGVMDAMEKYVVSSTLDSVDWNSRLLPADFASAIRELKAQPGGVLAVGGVTLPLALADLGLIDEYEFVVHPVVAGHGPTLFAGLAAPLDLVQVGRTDFAGGAVALRYRPRPAPA